MNEQVKVIEILPYWDWGPQPEKIKYVAYSDYEELREERDKLLKQLPESMKHCTILFKSCEKGHGWLTATNWVQYDCPTCERDRLRNTIKALTERD